MLSSKKELARELSFLENFDDAAVRLEQYKTDSEIAAELLWSLHMANELKGKTVADLGCGNGILGIGCLLLNAGEVFFVDKDNKALDIARENYKKLKLKHGKFFCCDVFQFDQKADVVIQNPPFGVKKKHADREFLDTAMKTSDVIYSFHKSESENFLKKYCENFKVEKIFEFDFILRKTYKFHKKEKHHVRAGLFRMNRKI